MTQTPSGRTIVVTGASRGIGAVTCDLLRERGDRVIGVDVDASADVTVDLSTAAGRDGLVAGVAALAPSGIHGIVANAGVRHNDSRAVAVNHFGAVATLEGLRPLLQEAPRAVVVASRAVLQPVSDELVDACLAGDEQQARSLGDELGGEHGPHDTSLVYASSKRAISRWMRRVAATDDWAGAGIPLNAVAPGGVLTDMILHRTPEQHAETLRKYPMPLGGQADPREIASTIAWFLAVDNTKVTGQLLFVDGGGELLMRGDDIWHTPTLAGGRS